MICGLPAPAASLVTAFAALKPKSRPRRTRNSRPLHRLQYPEQHIPVITSIRQIFLAAGWALLIGNLVFQAIRSMVVGLGFEGKDPKLLFTRTFVFSFLLVACPQIRDICLDTTSTLMRALDIPDAVEVRLVDSSAFGSLMEALKTDLENSGCGDPVNLITGSFRWNYTDMSLYL